MGGIFNNGRGRGRPQPESKLLSLDGAPQQKVGLQIAAPMSDLQCLVDSAVALQVAFPEKSAADLVDKAMEFIFSAAYAEARGFLERGIALAQEQAILDHNAAVEEAKLEQARLEREALDRQHGTDAPPWQGTTEQGGGEVSA